ncbi:hypothetical protein AA23498_1395 [Acetobacter nitrogenifigens DSM 23921 = NBRC 105050]|uniref:Uncharacterized protein n=1 Tax=Acetobacter nitrogenifigens DSM 23921 = NBRC 105050 TaxID=1120919 RepID=A0A511XFB3_9PROT|nr:hypothetical protein AA23498_1395 [Acetobacter nitrogenifigens DSM 23921 = NBRC 105050]GEN61628.1 hypothetical protein ANI02nite_35120 [Acetobacter nitrogenifigens DSM 23921 = NBRC 105050]
MWGSITATETGTCVLEGAAEVSDGGASVERHAIAQAHRVKRLFLQEHRSGALAEVQMPQQQQDGLRCEEPISFE